MCDYSRIANTNIKINKRQTKGRKFTDFITFTAIILTFYDDLKALN